MSDLLYSIGLDVTDLKTSAKVAKEQADDIKKGFKGFKDIIEFGGVGAAVYGFFRSVIDYAENLKGPLDENTAAVRRFGESIKEVKETSLSWGAQFLGFFNRAGEGLGALVRAAIDGGDAVREVAQQEREFAKERAAWEADQKKNKEEYKRISQEIANIEKQGAEVMYGQLTSQEQFNASSEKFLEIEKQLAEFNGPAIERRKLELEYNQAALAVLKSDAALKKDAAKADEEAIKLTEKKTKLEFEALDVAEQMARLAQSEFDLVDNIAGLKKLGLDTTQEEIDLLEIRAKLDKYDAEQEKESLKLKEKKQQLEFEAKTTAERITILSESQLAIEQAIAILKANGLSSDQEEIDLLEVKVELEKLRTAEIDKQIKKRKEEADAARKAAADAEFEKMAKPIIGTSVRSAKDFAYASDEALAALVSRNRGQAAQLRAGNVENYYEVRLEAGRLEQEANNAANEIKLRQRIRSTYETGGSAGVYRSFNEIDPLVLERLIAQFAEKKSSDQRTADNIASIEERLSTVFNRTALPRR